MSQVQEKLIQKLSRIGYSNTNIDSSLRILAGDVAYGLLDIGLDTSPPEDMYKLFLQASEGSPLKQWIEKARGKSYFPDATLRELSQIIAAGSWQ